jgi:ABC-2 type transport system permease protein
MRNAWVVTKKDIGSYFNSPVFYVVTTVFLVIHSFIFFQILTFFSFQSVQASQFRGMNIGLNLNDMVIEPSFHNMAVTLLLIIPVLTMRSFADEKKSKTYALLLSSPVQLREIIFGKFLACMTVVATMVLLSSYSIGFLFMLGEPEIGPIVTSYLGILLMSGCYVGMGVFASSLTDNQIIAAVLAFGMSLFMWIVGWAAQSASAEMGEVLHFISLVEHMQGFLKGIVDTSDVVYYLSFILFSLFLTHRVLDSERWR